MEFFAAVPKVAGLLTSMKTAIVAVPWSRVVATGILVGIAAGYGYALYCICS